MIRPEYSYDRVVIGLTSAKTGTRRKTFELGEEAYSAQEFESGKPDLCISSLAVLEWHQITTEVNRSHTGYNDN